MINKIHDAMKELAQKQNLHMEDYIRQLLRSGDLEIHTEQSNINHANDRTEINKTIKLDYKPYRGVEQLKKKIEKLKKYEIQHEFECEKSEYENDVYYEDDEKDCTCGLSELLNNN